MAWCGCGGSECGGGAMDMAARCQDYVSPLSTEAQRIEVLNMLLIGTEKRIAVLRLQLTLVGRCAAQEGEHCLGNGDTAATAGDFR